MKITKMTVYPLATPVCDKPYDVAYGSMTVGTHVVVKIETDEGIVGWGETSPHSNFYPETQETTVAALRDYFATMLVGKDPFDVAGIIAEMDRWVMEQWCAKAAVDLALHDIMGKALGVPAYKLIGGAYRKKLDSVEYDLSINTLEKTAKEAREQWELGVRSFEIKMGLDLNSDVERVRVVREELGDGAMLRVDMNEGYDIATAKQFAARTESYNLQFMEQPLPKWNKLGMAELRTTTNIPVCADQSAYTPYDVAELLAIKAMDYCCIKIGRSGFYRGRTIASMCESFGIRNTLGHMMTLGIGTRAIHHFTMATKNVALETSGVYGSPFDYFKVDILKEPIVVKNGVIEVPDKPGLGVEVDEEMLKKLTI